MFPYGRDACHFAVRIPGEVGLRGGLMLSVGSQSNFGVSHVVTQPFEL